jgi:hypothetical protein
MQSKRGAMIEGCALGVSPPATPLAKQRLPTSDQHRQQPWDQPASVGVSPTLSERNPNIDLEEVGYDELQAQ